MKSMSLAQLKQEMSAEAGRRQAVVDQGGRAYRLGIESRHCPLKEPSQRQLWQEGWDKARKSHETMFQQKERSHVTPRT